MNPASDFRGANLRSFIPGKWGGRGGVYLPQSRPSVDAVVSDHDKLHVSCTLVYREMQDSREDSNDGHVSRVDSQHKDHTYEVPDDPIDLLPLRLSHEETKP